MGHHLLPLTPILGLALFWLLPLSVALPVYLVATIVSVVVFVVVLRAMKAPVAIGIESMLGRTAEVRTWNGHDGLIWCYGELWSAHSAEPLALGEKVEITGFEGLKALVQRMERGRQT
jgi:membrane-bound serine protease (ClpP class)